MSRFQSDTARNELNELMVALAAVDSCFSLASRTSTREEALSAIKRVRVMLVVKIVGLGLDDPNPDADEHPPVRIPTYEEQLRHWRSYWADHPEQIASSKGHPLAMLGAVHFEDYIKGPKWGQDVLEFVEDYLDQESPIDDALIGFIIDWGHDGDSLPVRFIDAIRAYCDHMLQDVATPE